MHASKLYRRETRYVIRLEDGSEQDALGCGPVAGWRFRISRINRGDQFFQYKHRNYIHVNVVEIVI